MTLDPGPSSPECVEEEFSEVRMQATAWPRSLAILWSA
jgi:hypothetical protein